MTYHNDHTTLAGTATGTVFTVAANIDSQDYIKTVVLAIVGAAVSFAVSRALKWIWQKLSN
jgi:uncharacterized membrane protein (UPF0136 family)